MFSQEERHDGGMPELPALLVKGPQQLICKDFGVLHHQMQSDLAVLVASEIVIQPPRSISYKILQLLFRKIPAVVFYYRQVIQDILQQLLLVAQAVVRRQFQQRDQISRRQRTVRVLDMECMANKPVAELPIGLFDLLGIQDEPFEERLQP